MNLLPYTIDPALDLVLDRVLPVSPAKVWAAWTRPELLVQWFTPPPWRTVGCEIDLRPGGLFRTIMQPPEGEPVVNDGSYLEVVEGERLVFTDAMLPGFRPSGKPFMSAILLIEPHEIGAHYVALVRHADPATCERHRDMGFFEGWGTATDQLVALFHPGAD